MRNHPKALDPRNLTRLKTGQTDRQHSLQETVQKSELRLRIMFAVIEENRTEPSLVVCTRAPLRRWSVASQCPSNGNGN
jgi:hypothetical protein